MGEISEETKRPATSPFWKALEDSFGRNVTQHEWEIRLGDEYPLIRKSFLAQATKDNNLPDGIILAPTEWYSDTRYSPDFAQRQYLLKHFFGNHPPISLRFSLHSIFLPITNVEEAVR